MPSPRHALGASCGRARKIIRGLVCALLALAALAPALAQAAPSGEAPGEQAAKEQAAAPAPREESTNSTHVFRAAGSELSYTATAGLMPVEVPDEKAKASFFYVAYTQNGLNAAEKGRRPVTFAFNGGPGASSVWLHLGLMGPRRVALAPDGTTLPPPARLVDNAESWLPFTDLVFIDPVGTGYSRSSPDDAETRRKFQGVKQDIASVGEFIRLWLTRNQRWLSPLFVAGESYGTTRAAGLSSHLLDRYGIEANGIVLISTVLDLGTITFSGASDQPYVFYLPSYAAAARFHGRLAQPLAGAALPELLGEAERFASGTYLAGLFAGQALPEATRQELSGRVALFSGLEPGYVERHEGRVPLSAFTRELLRDKGILIGRMDATITGPDPFPVRPYQTYDPSLDPLYGPFSSAINSYLRGDLGYASDLVYEILSSDVNRAWDWSSGLEGGQGYVRTSDDLRAALAVNRSLKVFVACGIYDLATPYYAARHTVEHLGLSPERRQDVILKNYEAGHMMYTHEAARQELTRDAAAFYSRAAGSAKEGS